MQASLPQRQTANDSKTVPARLLRSPFGDAGIIAQPAATLLGATQNRRRRRDVRMTSIRRVPPPVHRRCGSTTTSPSDDRSRVRSGSQLPDDPAVVTAEAAAAQADSAYKTRKEHGHGKYPRGIELGKPTLRLRASVTSRKCTKASPLRPPPRHRRRESCLPDLRSAKWPAVRLDEECSDRNAAHRRARGASRCAHVASRLGREPTGSRSTLDDYCRYFSTTDSGCTCSVSGFCPNSSRASRRRRRSQHLSS
jgi:hypothetical protein